MYYLTAFISGRATSFPLEAGSCRIGRGDGNDIVVKNGSISRFHAELSIEDDRIVIRDLGSTHGTKVNGSLIAGPTPLHTGDKIRCGRQEFIVRNGPPSVEEPFGQSFGTSTPQLLEPDSVHSMDRLNVQNAGSDDIQSPELVHALLTAVTDAGQILTAARPLNEVFNQVIGLVAQVIPARRILLLTIDSPEAEPLARAARPPLTPDGPPLVLSRTIIGTVFRERQSLLLNDVSLDPRFNAKESILQQSLRSAMVAPLFDDLNLMGLLYADHDDIFCIYNKDQLRAFTLLANLIAIKITNTRLLESERVMLKMEEELASAARVQRSMLPAAIPEIPGYSVSAHQITCLQVGGDLYDLARLDDGRIAFVVGDVSGKGMSAALLMSNVIACLRVLYQDSLEPSCLADRLNRQLLSSTEDNYFVTLFLGILDPVNHRIDYVNAGHNPPLLLCGDAEPTPLTATGYPLGLVEGAQYKAASVDVPEDSLLCVYSDGIPEACVLEEFYGEDRFLASLRTHQAQPVGDAMEGVFEDLKSFLGATPPPDDITLLLLRRKS